MTSRFSLYKLGNGLWPLSLPPNSTFAFEKPVNFDTKNIHIIIGDFNCHHSNWGYDEIDSNGDQVEVWAESNRLILIHDTKLPPSFNSGRWKKGYVAYSAFMLYYMYSIYVFIYIFNNRPN